MDITNDPEFISWQKNMKENTAETYAAGLVEFCEFTGKQPSQLLEEARDDYIARVAPWEVRQGKAIELFTEHLKKKKCANWTKLGRINAVRNFYKFNKIPVLVNATYIPSIASEKYLDIPILKMSDIRKFVLACGTKKLIKALILTFISSGQAQGEILKLKGKHLKNIVNSVAIISITRGKTNQRYSFFISGEALEAIHDYKPVIKDDEYIFTLKKNNLPLYHEFVGDAFAAHARSLGFDRGYFAPHRARHFFKTSLTGIVDSTFVEYWLGHKPRGTDANYFIGSSIQDRMLEAYIKNLDKLTVFTDKEVLQKQYDELKGKVDTEKEELRRRLATIETKQASEIENLKSMIIAMGKAEKQKT